MKYFRLIIKWISIIVRILPILEKVYPQIITAIECIKEEIEKPWNDEYTKRINIEKRVLKKIKGISKTSAAAAIKNTVDSLKELGVITCR